jgi:hypothetical protein
VALALGYAFVWIDSLCIIQDSLKDWEAECPHMSSIYRNASVVFAASDSDLGLAGPAIINIHTPSLSNGNDHPIYARFFSNHHGNINDRYTGKSNTVFGRAWCMQERLFAPRIIHFGGSSGEVSFECATMTDCQCGHLSSEKVSRKEFRRIRHMLPLVLKYLQIDPTDSECLEELHRVYRKIIQTYTGMDLTYVNDTLPALSSIMTELAPYFGNYYAGLWEYKFIQSLAWQALDPRNCFRQGIVAPSFSWASIRGMVHWYHLLLVHDSDEVLTEPDDRSHIFATLLSVSCEVAGSDRFGRVLSGRVTLRGCAIDMVVLRLIDEGQGELKGILSKEGESEFESSPWVLFDTVDDFKEAREGLKVVCLNLIRRKDPKFLENDVVAVILLAVKSGDGIGRWRRIGISRTLHPGYFAGSSIMEITII